MNKNRFSRKKKYLGTRILFTIVILMSVLTISAQKPASFTGKWEFDKSKSILNKTDITYDGTVIRQIKQTSILITFNDTYIKPGVKDFKTADESYNLDGKEKTEKSSLHITRSSAKWSIDKKVLTITNISTDNSKGIIKEYLLADSYKLSDDGLTLTIERYSKNPVTGETKSKLVYRKK
jgi:hypothetical protein